MIFTTSPDALRSSYTPENVPYKDPKLSILFETQEMMEETIWVRTEGTAQEWQDVVEAPVAAAAGPDLLLAPHA